MDTVERIRCYVRVSGHVQGVGFRYFVSHTAALYSLTGWVCNLEDGDVELEAQGTHAEMDGFLEAVRRGNRYSDVRRVQVRRIPPRDHETGFSIGGW